MRKLQAFRRAPAVALFAMELTYAPPAAAHKTSYAYLNAVFSQGGVSGKIELAVRDFDAAFFDFAFGPGDGGGKVNVAQMKRHEEEIARLLISKFAIGPRGTPCSLKTLAIDLDNRGGETYLVLPFLGSCGAPGEELQVAYDLMFDIDKEHRALVDIRQDSGAYTGVMTPENRVLHFGAGTQNLAATILSYIRQGAHHIWIGYDHILFLVSLLLPAVLVRAKDKWLPAGGFAVTFWSTAKVVTAFTLAHSITLSAAAFGIVELPSRFVESVIAASVAAAAVNNIFPIVTHRLWAVAFIFGLMHGFGFACVLNELGLPPGQKLAALLAFNIGVELGQLAIVAALLPVLFLARRTVSYSRVVMPFGSALISVIALIWFVERATGTS